MKKKITGIDCNDCEDNNICNPNHICIKESHIHPTKGKQTIKDQIIGLKNEIEEKEFQLIELQSRHDTLLKQFSDLKEQLAEKDKLLAESVPKEKIEEILSNHRHCMDMGDCSGLKDIQDLLSQQQPEKKVK